MVEEKVNEEDCGIKIIFPQQINQVAAKLQRSSISCTIKEGTAHSKFGAISMCEVEGSSFGYPSGPLTETNSSWIHSLKPILTGNAG